VCDNPEGMRALMLENPVIIKRPVIVHPDGTVTVGVDEEAWERLAGGRRPPPSRAGARRQRRPFF